MNMHAGPETRKSHHLQDAIIGDTSEFRRQNLRKVRCILGIVLALWQRKDAAGF